MAIGDEQPTVGGLHRVLDSGGDFECGIRRVLLGKLADIC
jgi:hypothetical protein